MSQRFHLASKSGTCEICSDPCSSCMHRNGVYMGSEGNEFADVSCHGNASNQYSINEGDALPVVKSSVRENRQQAATETSNEVRVSSSHDSFTRNTENKAFTRSYNIADSSEDVVVLQKLTSGGTVAKDPLSPNPLCDFDQKASCIGDFKGIEGHDEHTSCVSTSKNSSAIDDCPNRKVDLKKISCGSISVGSKVATASVDEDSSEKYICVDSVVPGRCADNSIQKGLPNLLVDVSSNNLDAAELPLQENIDAIASSLKVQVLSSSQSHAFPHNAYVKGLEVNTSSQALDKLSEPLLESMNLSVKETVPDFAYSPKSAAREHSKDLLIGEGSKVTGEISPKSKLEVEEEIGGQLDASFKCSDQTEDVDMLKEVDQLPRVQESPEGEVMKKFQKNLIEVETEAEHLLLARHQLVENDRVRNGNREALTALRKRARTTTTSILSAFESIMREIGGSQSRPLVKEVCTTCGNHDSNERTWMMFPGTDAFFRIPFHAIHTVLEEDQTRLDYESKKLQSLVKEKSFLISDKGALADKISPGVMKSFMTLKDTSNSS